MPGWARYGDRGGIIWIIGVQKVIGSPTIPFGAGDTETGRWPHRRISCRNETVSSNGRSDAISNSTANPRPRCKHALLNSESRVRAGDGGHSRRHFDLRRLRIHIDWFTVIGRLCRNRQPAQDLHRKEPRFKFPACSPRSALDGPATVMVFAAECPSDRKRIGFNRE